MIDLQGLNDYGVKVDDCLLALEVSETVTGVPMPKTQIGYTTLMEEEYSTQITKNPSMVIAKCSASNCLLISIFFSQS